VAIFPDASPERIVRALGVQLPTAALVTLVVGDDVPVSLTVHRRGSAVVAIKLDDHASPKAVEAAVTQLTAVLGLRPSPTKPAKAPAKPAKAVPQAFRHVVYRLLEIGDVVPHNHFASITRGAAEDPSSYVGFTYVHDTRIRDLTEADLEDDEEEDEDEPPPPPKAAVAPAKAAKPAPGDKPAKQIIRIAPAEAAELTATFQHARTDLSRPETVAGAERQLATATNATAWLAVRRTIDPARVTNEVIVELVDVIRNGRFLDEGERATVVREAAAMLLGRALKAHKATAQTVALLRQGSDGGAAAQACWDIVLRMAGLAKD
jgi:hypothetical protein